MTRRISLVAVCCSSASMSWRLRVSSSLNSRTFSIAMTAWLANVSRSLICLSEKGGPPCGGYESSRWEFPRAATVWPAPSERRHVWRSPLEGHPLALLPGHRCEGFAGQLWLGRYMVTVYWNDSRPPRPGNGP
jgi:hypothetical protein